MNENMEINSVAKEKKSIFQALKSFWKTNSDTVIKLFVHQVGLTVFGLLLYFAAEVSGNKPLVIGLGIFSTLFYLFLLYVLAWDVGAKDKIRIDGGRLERDPFKGAKFAFAGMIPNLIMAVLVLIGYICIDKSITDEAGKLLEPAWAISLYVVVQFLGLYLNGMYLGIGDVLGIAYQPYYLFIIIIPAIIVCGLGYYLGSYEKLGILTSLPATGKKKR